MDGRGVLGDVSGRGDVLRVTRSLAIPMHELEWRFGRSGGPGGQHANTTDTRAEVIFDVEASQALGPRQRTRLLEKLGPRVVVAASDERSQARNRELALDRLRSKLADALKVPKRRRPTKPSAAAKRRRVEEKRRHGRKKRLRRPPSPDE